jgi:hypothetical protein
MEVEESFDAGHPAAEAIRALLPPESAMSDEARERLMGHVLSIQRRASRERASRGRSRSRVAFAGAAAVLVIAAVLAAVLVPLLAGNKPAAAAQLAKLDSLSGRVEVAPPSGAWRAATRGARLREGWKVRTGAGALASVAFSEGSIMRVTDGSEAALGRMSRRSVSIEHISGSTYHRVQAGTRYLVSNRDVSTRAVGTAFNVDNRAPGSLEILSVEHQVDVAIRSHKAIRVTEGEEIVVSTAQDRRAVKKPVSRERLNDDRLRQSVQKDAQAGFGTGIYAKLDVPLSASQPPGPVTSLPISLSGGSSEKGVSLEWALSPGVDCRTLVLLRSELAEPSYPSSEVSRYSSVSMTSATDDSVGAGRTYQYRLVALGADGGPVAYSNTVVITVPEPGAKLEPASVTLSSAARASGIGLEWSVSGASRFDGFVVERLVEKAPGGSSTPAGTTTTRNVDSTNVFFTLLDDAVSAGHTYRYRIGVVIGGAVMVYSNPVTVEFAGP